MKFKAVVAIECPFKCVFNFLQFCFKTELLEAVFDFIEGYLFVFDFQKRLDNRVFFLLVRTKFVYKLFDFCYLLFRSESLFLPFVHNTVLSEELNDHPANHHIAA